MPETGYQAPQVTLQKPAWQRTLDPLYKAFNGDDYLEDINDLWDDREEPGLDWFDHRSSFQGGEELELGGTTGETAPIRIVLPRTTNPGDHEADLRAVTMGVDPSRGTGGTGSVIDLMRSQLGAQYVWGAESPDQGFDCSSAIYWAFNRAGINIPRSTAEGYQSIFAPVSREELQAGDVIFYNYGRKGGGRADHIEVYMGDGKQIGTSNPNEDLDIDEVDWDNVIGFGRAPGAGGGGIDIDAGTANTVKSGGKRRLPKPTPIDNESSLAPLGLANDVTSAFLGGR